MSCLNFMPLTATLGLPRILGEELTETRGFEGDEWLKTGNCPIAKSYQACEQSAAPSWRRSSSLPAGIHYRCSRGNRRGPRAAIARTAYAKNPPPSAPYPQRSSSRVQGRTIPDEGRSHERSYRC
ncbi:hypothetical protein MLD38_018980 [Melastoma candidum]|uniref:Uncharacterized protein n=1 Tax=Melastoma candidum TaxID=119954 RepID=A0ACB9QZ06_9MYRT|nr:hypothetical protein MLD38_018980 [Melastoma candidum]